MNPRSTLILAIVAALLGAFVYVYEIGGEVERGAIEEAGKRVFPGLDVDSIEAISLESQDGTPARFLHRDGIWEMIDPVKAPADSAALDAMASVLSQLAREGRVDDPGPLSEYGLGDGARTISFEAGGQSRELLIGRGTPVGGHLYVSTRDASSVSSSTVSFVETFRLNAFNRNLADLRDRRISPFEAADVTKISLEWPEGEVELEKEQDQTWRMLAPATEPADEHTVRSLLDDLSFLRAESFVDVEDASTTAALDRVSLDVRLTADGQARRITIGSVIEGGTEGARIVRGRAGRLFRIPAERLDDFERSVPAYRFRTLSEFESSSARKVVLGFAPDGAGESRQVEARLEKAAWSSDQWPVDSGRFDSLVQTLSQLRAITVVADEMGPVELASFGLAPPRAQIRIEQGGEGDALPLSEVFVGRIDPDRGLFAQRAGDSKIYLLDSVAADSIPISWTVFESHFLAGAEMAEAAEAGETTPNEGDEDPLFDLKIP